MGGYIYMYIYVCIQKHLYICCRKPLKYFDCSRGQGAFQVQLRSNILLVLVILGFVATAASIPKWAGALYQIYLLLILLLVLSVPTFGKIH